MQLHLPAFAAVAAALALSAPHALARDAGTPQAVVEDPARPTDPTANLPSAIGSQTTTPAGAVTGAGHAQSPELRDFNYGRPGGLQQQAREREGAVGVTPGTGPTTTGAAEGRPVGDGAQRR